MRNKVKIVGNVAYIQINRKDGKPLKAIVDKRDLPKLRELDAWWCALKDYTVKGYDKYYVGVNAGGTTILLHRYLWGDVADGYVVDHIDGNPLNNRRKNLRLLTPSQNALNRKGAELRSKSGVLGVAWHKGRGKWRGRVKYQGKAVFEKYYKEEDLELAGREVAEVRQKLIDGTFFD